MLFYVVCARIVTIYHLPEHMYFYQVQFIQVGGIIFG